MWLRGSLLLMITLTTGSVRAEPGNEGNHDRGRPIRTGEPAPAFAALPVLNGKATGSKQLAFEGRPAGTDRAWVLSFFATWCPGCVNEMPMLRRLHDDYRARGVRVVSVSIDRAPDAEARIKALLDKNGIRHPVLVDTPQQVLRLYQGGSTSLPFIYVIGPDGLVVKTHEGFDESTEATLRAELDQLVPRSGLSQNK